jgi:hypothetical protein
MDIFGTTITVMHEVYNITLFIRAVVADIKAYDTEKRTIQDKLEHEFLFLNSFKDLFFDNEGLMGNRQLPMNLKRDVQIILSALKKALTEYESLAAKHGFFHEDDGQTGESESVSHSSFRERLGLKMRDLRRSVNWALFDKEKILETLKEYSEWTGRLRQTMSLVLLTLSAFKGTALEDFAKSKRAKDLRLQGSITRQVLARSEPPQHFKPLEGHIVGELKPNDDSNMIMAKYEDDWGRSENVVVEVRRYNKDLVRATKFHLPDLDNLKAPIRDLAWLLHKSSFCDDKEGDLTATWTPLTIFTLQCIGYIDQPGQYQTLFLHQIPPSEDLQNKLTIVTLHDWISLGGDQAQQPLPKPPLENRFFLAYALSLTVFNIHGSGWVHKNIWSRGVAIFPSKTTHHQIPYLNGWGLARPTLGGTDLAADGDIETNFYRHPVRQGYPETPFTIQHDLYALGVMLLEIGLWRTVSTVFKKQIRKAKVENRLPPPEKIREALVEKARSEVPCEMGRSYTRAIERCLMGDFGVEEIDRNGAALSMAFRKTVMDVIADGVKL